MDKKPLESTTLVAASMVMNISNFIASIELATNDQIEIAEATLRERLETTQYEPDKALLKAVINYLVTMKAEL